MTTKAEPARAPGRGKSALAPGDARGRAEGCGGIVVPRLPRTARTGCLQDGPRSSRQTLQPTALVHEAWLRLGLGEGARFPDRSYSSPRLEAMRRILVEAARRKRRLKHGGNLERVDIENVDLAAPCPMTTCWPWTKRSPGSPSRTPVPLSW